MTIKRVDDEGENSFRVDVEYDGHSTGFVFADEDLDVLIYHLKHYRDRGSVEHHG